MKNVWSEYSIEKIVLTKLHQEQILGTTREPNEKCLKELPV